MESASADTKSFIQNLSIQIVPIVSGGLIRAEDVVGGEEIFVAGYPLGNMVSDSMRLVPGLVNATKGYENDITQFETDASIKMMNRWKKERSFAITTSGYHTYFGMASSALHNDGELVVKEDATKAEIKRAFAKSLKARR